MTDPLTIRGGGGKIRRVRRGRLRNSRRGGFLFPTARPAALRQVSSFHARGRQGRAGADRSVHLPPDRRPPLRRGGQAARRLRLGQGGGIFRRAPRREMLFAKAIRRTPARGARRIQAPRRGPAGFLSAVFRGDPLPVHRPRFRRQQPDRRAGAFRTAPAICRRATSIPAPCFCPRTPDSGARTPCTTCSKRWVRFRFLPDRHGGERLYLRQDVCRRGADGLQDLSRALRRFARAHCGRGVQQPAGGIVQAGGRRGKARRKRKRHPPFRDGTFTKMRYFQYEDTEETFGYIHSLGGKRR